MFLLIAELKVWATCSVGKAPLGELRSFFGQSSVCNFSSFKLLFSNIDDIYVMGNHSFLP